MKWLNKFRFSVFPVILDEKMEKNVGYQWALFGLRLSDKFLNTTRSDDVKR